MVLRGPGVGGRGTMTNVVRSVSRVHLHSPPYILWYKATPLGTQRGLHGIGCESWRGPRCTLRASSRSHWPGATLNPPPFAGPIRCSSPGFCCLPPGERDEAGAWSHSPAKNRSGPAVLFQPRSQTAPASTPQTPPVLPTGS